jgi:hypothetical protein
VLSCHRVARGNIRASICRCSLPGFRKGHGSEPRGASQIDSNAMTSASVS